MDFIFVIASILHFTSTASKRLDMSSEESIENILFYKDFRPKKKELLPLPPEPLVLPSPVKQPECIPRMCCSMSCTNSCGQNEIGPESLQRNQPSFMNPMNSMGPMNSMSPMNSMNPMNPINSANPMNPFNPMNSMNSPNQINSMNPMNPMQNRPPGQQPKQIPPFRKKKKLPPLPMPTRRDISHTREHIKSLISQDEDIKKILKDLVRVTMKKVDLLEMIKARRAMESGNAGFGNTGLNDNDNDNNDDDGKEL